MVAPEPSRSKGAIDVKSFGFKYGDNPTADLQFDLRSRIKNPQANLPKGAVGISSAVKKAVLGSDTNKRTFERFVVRVRKYLKTRENAIISFGCRSGIHRSVVFAEELAARLRDEGYEVRVTHVHLRIDNRSPSKRKPIRIA